MSTRPRKPIVDPVATAQPVPVPPAPVSLENLKADWQAKWPAALATWSAFTMLREPDFFMSHEEAVLQHMAGEIAAIRLIDQMVMVNLATVQESKLDDLALEVLAHEIGHHVFVPGNLSDNARMIAAIKYIYVNMPNSIPHMLANLYGDLMINDRLQRRAGLDIAGVYKKLKERSLALKDPKGAAEPSSEVWKVYTRTYEHLWGLKAETISPAGVSDGANADAMLLARMIRSFGGDWLRGVKRFAYVMYPYIAEDEKNQRPQTFVRLGLGDTRRSCCGGAGGEFEAIPNGLTGMEDWEIGDDGGDGFEDDVLGSGDDDDGFKKDGKDRVGRAKPKIPKPLNTVPTQEGMGQTGQFREPFEYAELLKALGLNLSEFEITTRYYRERALPHLIPFRQRQAPHVSEPLAEGTESWEAGEPLDNLDMMSSLMRSPILIPGVTTEQRVYGETPGQDPARAPMDLDIYVDCSGSMPCPSVNISYLALAGSILALSALRAGARVQATLWSGAGQFDTTHGFVRDEKRVMGIVTGYINGGTAFPLSVLRETYRNRKPDDAPAHIVIISDDGVDTILAKDEKGIAGAKLCTEALARARGGATMVLNLASDNWKPAAQLTKLGFAIYRVRDWAQLVAFAREFVRKNYEE